jgi:hypothetical protein
MQMKNVFLFLFYLGCFSVDLLAQSNRQGMEAAKPFENKAESNFTLAHKLYVGGNVGFQAGSAGASFNVAPMVGYNLTEDFSIGLGSSYLFLKQKIVSPTHVYDFSTHVFGGSVFARYFILDQIFAHGEYEILNLKTYDSFDSRRNVGAFLIGAGYQQVLGEHFLTNISILYAISESAYSPYANPLVIRPGFFYRF